MGLSEEQLLNNSIYNILIVEDDSKSALAALKIINKYGFKGDTADNGRVAVDMFWDNNYDIILMDIMMPVLDGIEATKIIRNTEKGKNIPIICLTANEHKFDEALDALANVVMIKPYDVDSLVQHIHELLNLKQ